MSAFRGAARAAAWLLILPTAGLPALPAAAQTPANAVSVLSTGTLVHVALDGRHREEGTNRGDASAAAVFVAGVFAGLIKGDHGGIPRGRELRARIGENLEFAVATEAAAGAAGALEID